MDHGTIHLSLEYGIKDWLEIGIGRSTFEKTVDGYLKARILRQSTGSKNMPVHLTYLGSVEWITLPSSANATYNTFHSRLSYINQLMIARKFSDKFSAQLSPTFIHRNVPPEFDKNDLFSIGSGARYKLTKWVAISVEYFYVFRTNACRCLKYVDRFKSNKLNFKTVKKWQQEHNLNRAGKRDNEGLLAKNLSVKR